MIEMLTLAAVLAVLVFGMMGDQPPRGQHRVRRLRPAAVRMHLAEGTVDDTPLESGSRWILVRDGNRVRVVAT